MPPAITINGETSKTEQSAERPRKRLPISFMLAGIAILGAVLYLVYANTQTNAAYYMTVSELKHCADCTVQTVRVAGIVKAGTIVRDDSKQLIQFTVEDQGLTMPVSYTGVVPDIFRPGIQVVVEGHYSKTGAFQAQTLLAKCPSKFQSATPTP